MLASGTRGRAEGASRLSAELGHNALLERGKVFLPVLAIELNDFWVFACEVIVIENSDIHSVKIRRSPRSGKDVNATGLAEVMFCDLGPKLISTKVGLARQQVEVIRCDTVMKDALLAADRAVAFGHTINDSFDLESHGTAVAASDVAWHFYGTQRRAVRRAARNMMKAWRFPPVRTSAGLAPVITLDARV